MKVGILTFHWATNHGALLQTYALQKTLTSMLPDSTVEVIDYWPDRYKKTIFKSLLGRRFKVIKRNFKDLNKEKNLSSFRALLPKSRRFFSQQQLMQEDLGYDVVIAGSDQIWNQSFTMNGEGGKTAAYYLPFSKSATRISYAASFGTKTLNDETIEFILPFLNDLDAISVRENSGKELLGKIGIDSTVVCDPSALLSSSDYQMLAKHGKDNDFIAYYMLHLEDNCINKEIMQFFSRQMLKDIEMSTEEEWIGSISDASFLVTNSYHGMMVALKLHTPFAIFLSTGVLAGMNERFYTILGQLGLMNRIVSKDNPISKIYSQIIDWKSVDNAFERYVAESKEFLVRNCVSKIKQKHINIQQRSDCCGCSACEQTCKMNCIDLKEDCEGFLYPQVNDKNCFSCGACLNVCPIINSSNSDRNPIIASFIGRTKEPDRLKISSSGGVFQLLANQTIEKGGLVYGTVFSDDFSELSYKSTSKKEDLNDFSGSKYIQANKNDVFTSVQKALNDERCVLFCGTPCEVEGLQQFLIKSRTSLANLILVDFICHGVPSPKVWREYKYILEKRYNSKVCSVEFRNKDFGWESFSMKIVFDNGKKYQKMMDEDPFLRGFLKDLYLRPSCYNCSFKGESRVSDITIGDAWGIQNYAPVYNDHKGASVLFVHSNKGYKAIDKLGDCAEFVKIDDVRIVSNYNIALYHSPALNPNRNVFFNEIDDFSEKSILRYCRDPFLLFLKKRIKRMVRK